MKELKLQDYKLVFRDIEEFNGYKVYREQYKNKNEVHTIDITGVQTNNEQIKDCDIRISYYKSTNGQKLTFDYAMLKPIMEYLVYYKTVKNIDTIKVHL